MKRLAVIGIGLAVIVYQPPIASAQQPATVGDVLNSGGKKLTKDEALRLYSSSTVSGIQGGNFPDTTFQNKNGADGSVNGNAWKKGVWFTTVTGTWMVNDSGQICQNLVNSQGSGIAAGCSFYYSVAARYYAASTDDRSAAVHERQFTRN